MPKLHSLLIGTALSMALPFSASAQDLSADTVVATVGGTEITIGHMIAMTATLDPQQQQLPAEVLFEGVLERLIQQEAIAQSQSEPSRITKLQMENEARSLQASEVVNAMADEVEVTPEQLQAAYDAQYADFQAATEYNASHILVNTEKEAEELVAELANGGDFAELAKTKSTGPSGPNGGQLGWFGTGRMVPAFEAAVVALEVGQVSAPVQTQFGWHVIILNDSRNTQAPSLEEVQAELEQSIWREVLQARIEEMVTTAGVDRADMSGIDPTVVGNLDLIAN